MPPTATGYSQPVMTVADEQLATKVLLVEWLVKLQQQLSLQQRLIEQQQQQISAQQQEIEELKEERDKLKNRDSRNSSVPPSSDQLRKPSDKSKRQKGKKRGPKSNHEGKTRNGFGTPDQIVNLSRENCPPLPLGVKEGFSYGGRRGGARSDWGAELVAQMFSFLETMRLQGENAIAQLWELLSLAGRSPPGLQSPSI